MLQDTLKFSMKGEAVVCAYSIYEYQYSRHCMWKDTQNIDHWLKIKYGQATKREIISFSPSSLICHYK